MARDDLYFRLRIPDDLKKLVAEAARDNNRSMTAEIIHRLERTFMTKQQLAEEEIVEMNKETRQRLARIEEKLEGFEFDRIFERIAKEATIKRRKPPTDSTSD